MKYALVFAPVFALVLGCGSTSAPDAPSLDAGSTDAPLPLLDAGEDAPTPRERFEVIEERMVTVLDVPRRVELIRGTRIDGVHTYLLYVHATAEPAPLMILNQPYAGIDWTGEAVDARWAAQGPGLQPDVDAPAYDGDDVTSYAPQTVQAAAEDGLVWLANGMAVVQVYARFYAGGSLADDAEDAAMGYAFAASRAREIDVTRIGSFGGSWGGMMALFGAARADRAHARAVVAMAPPSDFIDLYQHTQVEMPVAFPRPADVEAFFSPYWRRATPAIGFPPLATDPRALEFSPAGLCEALPDDVMVPHDDWDLLIPVRDTERLAAACGSKVRPLYFRRGPIDYATTPLDHGPFNSDPVFSPVLTLSTLHLLHALLPASAMRLAIGHGASLETFLVLVRAARDAGEDVSWAVLPLREVADARVSLLDPSTGSFIAGGDMLLEPFNRVFSTSFDVAGLRAQLEIGLP